MTRDERAASGAGPVVWVTGAAGGIGRGICDAYAESGARIVATDRRGGEALASVHVLACDITRAGDIDLAIAACERLGGVDVLVNCAGVLRRDNALEMTPQAWDEVFDVNVKGALRCAQAAARSMIAGSRRGAIVNIGSVNADKVFPDTVAYCSSKGALHALGRAMALSLAPHGIRVNTVAPGAVPDTALEPERWASASERETMRARTPLRGLGTTTDVAAAVMFLGSPAARFITGATLFVDGGRTASV